MRRYGQGYDQTRPFKENSLIGREEFSWSLLSSLEFLTQQNQNSLLELHNEDGFLGYGYAQAQLDLIERTLFQVKHERHHIHLASSKMGKHYPWSQIEPLNYFNPSGKGETNKLGIKKITILEESVKITKDYLSRQNSSNLDFIALPIIHHLTAQLQINSWGNQLNKPLVATLHQEASHAIEEMRYYIGPCLTFSTKISLDLDRASQKIVDSQIARLSSLLRPTSAKPGEIHRTSNKFGADQQMGTKNDEFGDHNEV